MRCLDRVPTTLGDLDTDHTPEALYTTPRSSYMATFIDAGTIVRGKNIRD
jgi:hypothetical protein